MRQILPALLIASATVIGAANAQAQTSPSIVASTDFGIREVGRDATALSNLASATGSGNTLVSGQLRTFSFTARTNSDGSAQGTAVVDNRAIGEMFQLELDCLQVAGDAAVMSGTITRHTDVSAIGLTGIFGVVDRGEGEGTPRDLVSQVFFVRPGSATCQDIDPAQNADLAVPIVSGNVQVH